MKIPPQNILLYSIRLLATRCVISIVIVAYTVAIPNMESIYDYWVLHSLLQSPLQGQGHFSIVVVHGLCMNVPCIRLYSLMSVNYFNLGQPT